MHDPLGEYDSDNTSASRPPWRSGNMLSACKEESPTTEGHQHHQQWDHSSSLSIPSMMGDLPNHLYQRADAAEGLEADGAGGGSGGGDTQTSVTRHRPGTWSSLVADNVSDGIKSERMGTTGPEGNLLLTRNSNRTPKSVTTVKLTVVAYTTSCYAPMHTQTRS